MPSRLNVGQHDSGWVLDVLCSDADGPVELSGASDISAFVEGLGGLPPGTALPCTAELDYVQNSGKHAIARHVGTAQEASVSGEFIGRIQVTWPDGTVRSFPTTADFFEVWVTRRP